MIYREQGYVSDCARELIKIVRQFNWELAAARAAAGTDRSAIADQRSAM